MKKLVTLPNDRRLGRHGMSFCYITRHGNLLRRIVGRNGTRVIGLRFHRARNEAIVAGSGYRNTSEEDVCFVYKF